MRRKRRSRGNWFPVLGTTGADIGSLNYRETGIEFQVSTHTIASNGQAGKVVCGPVTFDRAVQPEENQGDYDIAAMQGNGWFLKRIVGKFAAFPFADATAGTPAFLKLGLGFFVARQEEGPDNNVDFPLGWYGPGGTGTNYAGMNYDPLSAHCANEPWIWRRTWILPNESMVADDRWTPGPAAVTSNGSVMDSGHIDAKTKRVIGLDERLWYAASAIPFPFATANRSYTYSSAMYAVCDLDVRLFGTPIKPRNRGAF